MILSKLGAYRHQTEQAYVKLKRGKSYQLYCDSCPFELAPNVDTVRRCPHCDEWLKTWSLSRGGEIKRKGIK